MPSLQSKFYSSWLHHQLFRFVPQRFVTIEPRIEARGKQAIECGIGDWFESAVIAEIGEDHDADFIFGQHAEKRVEAVNSAIMPEPYDAREKLCPPNPSRKSWVLVRFARKIRADW